MGSVARNLNMEVLVSRHASVQRYPSVSICLKTTYLVSETLRRYDSNFITNALVCLEVEGQLGIVPLNDNFSGLFDRLLQRISILLFPLTVL